MCGVSRPARGVFEEHWLQSRMIRADSAKVNIIPIPIEAITIAIAHAGIGRSM